MAMTALDGGRIHISSCAIGGAEFCMDKTIEYMK